MAFVTFTFNPVPAPACYPPDINGLAQELTEGGMLSGSIPDSAGGGLTVSSTPPSSSLSNKLWLKTDVAGRPIGFYSYYNGNWRRVYTGSIGDIKMYSGTNTVFDGTGRGIVGSDEDGWCLCNGNNGTPNLANRFMIGASQYGAGWQANPDGTGMHSSGGTGVINCVNLPDLWTVGWAAIVQQSTSGTLVLTNSPTAQPMDMPVKDLINDCQPSGQRPLMPPYYALAYLMFVGYQ